MKELKDKFENSYQGIGAIRSDREDWKYLLLKCCQKENFKNQD